MLLFTQEKNKTYVRNIVSDLSYAGEIKQQAAYNSLALFSSRAYEIKNTVEAEPTNMNSIVALVETGYESNEIHTDLSNRSETVA